MTNIRLFTMLGMVIGGAIASLVSGQYENIVFVIPVVFYWLTTTALEKFFEGESDE